jgi:chemotaxis-related protein WspB
MLFLLFTLGASRYGIDCAPIVEIVPAVRLRPVPRAPDYVAGFFEYRGVIVPVLDMRQLVVQERCASRLSTRIIVVHFKPHTGPERLIGLMAERVTETVSVAPEQCKSSNITIDAAPYLGSVIAEKKEMIQCLQIDRLLPANVQDALFRP